MSTDLTPENERFVKSSIQDGRYQDRRELLNEALRLMRERDRRLAELRAEIQTGIDSGPSVPGREVFRRLEQTVERLTERASGG